MDPGNGSGTDEQPARSLFSITLPSLRPSHASPHLCSLLTCSPTLTEGTAVGTMRSPSRVGRRQPGCWLMSSVETALSAHESGARRLLLFFYQFVIVRNRAK